MVDALALRADERRDKLRKASGRSKYPEIRRYLNGETYLRRPQVSTAQSISCGTAFYAEPRTFCRTVRRVTLAGEVKG